jgi:hypothetical protein
LRINPGWLIFFPLVFFFSSFNIKLFDNWDSWYYSIFFRARSPWYHDLIKDFACWPKWAWIKFLFLPFLNHIFFINFYPSTFYLLEIELHFFLWSYHILIWFIRNWSLNFFTCVSLYEIISILCSWSQSLRVKPNLIEFFVVFFF